MSTAIKFLGAIAFIGLAGVGSLTLVGNGNIHFAILGVVAILAAFIADSIKKGNKS
jgi:hypothetical protein